MKQVNTLLLMLTTIGVNLFAQTNGVDTDFGTNGYVTTDINGKFDDATNIEILPDGDILVAGNSMPGSHFEFMIARYNEDGTLDETFGDNGFATAEFSTFHCMVNGMAVQEDGKIVLVGNYDNNYYTDPVIVRLNEDGSLDTSFGGTGIIKFDLSAQFDDFNDVVIQEDNKIVVAGSSFKFGTDDFLLVRFLENGTPDPSFGTDGFVYTDFDETEDIIYNVLLQADNKIVVSGYSGFGSVYFAAARYHSNGTLDATFSIDGMMTIGSGSRADKCYGMAMQSDSSFILAGNHHAGAIDEYMIARIDKNGVLDNTFGFSGVASIATADPADKINAVIVQPDDKIVLCGSRDENAMFARLTKNGTLDATFGADGILVADSEANGITLQDLAIDEEQGVIACGSSLGEDEYTDFLMMKITVDVQTGVSDYSVTNYMADVFPNPATDLITITTDLSIGNINEVIIRDLKGRVLYHNEFLNEPSATTIQLPNDMAAGTYFLTVVNETGISTGKFQVIK